MAFKRQHEHETDVEEDDCTGVTAKQKKWLTKFKGCFISQFYKPPLKKLKTP
jgi:hypothetical protein